MNQWFFFVDLIMSEMKWTNIEIGSCEGECLEFKILDQFSLYLF